MPGKSITFCPGLTTYKQAACGRPFQAPFFLQNLATQLQWELEMFIHTGFLYKNAAFMSCCPTCEYSLATMECKMCIVLFVAKPSSKSLPVILLEFLLSVFLLFVTLAMGSFR
jgi:hypothetical protein